MSSTAYSDLKRATQSLLDRNIEPTLEAFRHFFPHIIKDQLQYASIRNEVDWWKHKHRKGQRQIGVDVALVPFHRPETDKATRKYSRKRAANLNRVSLSPGGNEDISNDHVSGCNDNGKRAVVNAALGSEDARYNEQSMATEEKGIVHEIVTIGNKRKMRKISLDSTVPSPPHECFEASISKNEIGDKEPSSESRGNDSNEEINATTGMSTLSIKKRETHVLSSKSTDPSGESESVEATTTDVGIQKGAQSQENLNSEEESIVFPFRNEHRKNETIHGNLTVFPNDQEEEKGIRPITPTDDVSMLSSRRGQAADTQDASVKKRKGHENGNNIDTELTQDQGLRKKTKLRIRISKPHMKKRQLDKVSSNNSIVEAPVSRNEYDGQLGALIKNSMLHSENGDERNKNASSNQEQKSASSILNTQHARLNTNLGTTNTNQLMQQYHLQQCKSSYREAAGENHVVCNSMNIASTELLECDDSLKACQGNDTIHSELPSKPIPFKKANDEEGYMKVKKIIQGMMDEGIQRPASKFYKKYPELTSKYEKRSLVTGIGGIVRMYKAKKAAAAWKEQSMSHPQDEATKRLSIPFKKANNKEGYMKVKEIIEGMVDEGIQRPASKFYEKYPELTSKYEKSSLSSGIANIRMYKAQKDALLGNKDLTSTVQDDAEIATTTTTNSPQRLNSTSIAVMNTSDVQADAKSLRDSTNMEHLFKPIHFKKANDDEGFQKVKEIIHGMMDEGVEDPQNAFFQKCPSLANKYEKGSIRLGVHSFCKNYKIKKANEEKKNQSLLLEQEKQKLIQIEAKNGLENYCYSLNTSISSPEVEGKIPADDKTKLEGAIDETLQWLVSNLSVEKEEYEKKQKALEVIAAPLFEHLKALETDKCIDNEEPNSAHQCTDEIAVSEQSKSIEITDFDKFLGEKAISLAEWILDEIIKFNSANVRLKCKEYAEELIKLGFYDREMMKNFCTVEIVDSKDFTSFMKLAHRLSLKKWLLEHGAST